ncbi:9472_t:CDS:2 [Cetraspora pellucida]|uniref:9472_t:CDS:1 n=1 Tax=Cetraspora pellucida TaxID=1433469 RepID=A0A9N9FDB7_9GLOM|nr:9472_t:CDS:2 [Cetraspora pellucida]
MSIETRNENLVNHPEHVAPDKVAHVTQQSSTALDGVGANEIGANPIDESAEKPSTIKESVSETISKTIDAVKETFGNIVGTNKPTDADKKSDDSKTNGESKDVIKS